MPVSLALPTCALCDGTGIRASGATCRCVLREVSRRLFRFAENARQEGGGRIRRRRRGTYDRPVEEFQADFAGVAERALDARELAAWSLHVSGVAWRDAVERLGLDKGKFFHAVYRAECKLGQACLDEGLYPLGQYFDIGRTEKVEEPCANLLAMAA